MASAKHRRSSSSTWAPGAHAKFIGRVGALAITLGVGFSATQGIAYALPDGSSSPDTKGSGGGETGTGAGSEKSGNVSGVSGGVDAPGTTATTGTTGTSTRIDPPAKSDPDGGTTTGTGSPDSGSGTTQSGGTGSQIRSAPIGVALGTGGLVEETKASPTNETKASPTNTPTPSASPVPEAPATQTPTPSPTAKPSPSAIEPTQATLPPPDNKSAEVGATATLHDVAPMLNKQVVGSSAAKATSAVIAPDPTNPPAPSAPFSKMAAARNVVGPTTTAVTQPQPPDLISAIIAVPFQILSSVLDAFGIGPSTVPTTPTVTPPFLDLVVAVFRRFESIFANQSPTAHPVQTGQGLDGTVTGTIGATDVDRDQLVYHVTTGPDPAKGTVVVNSDGTYAYTPTAAFARAGGDDTFTVTVSDDTNTHLHLFGDHAAVVPVTVHVSAVNTAPTPDPTNPFTTDPPLPSDPPGTVRGHVSIAGNGLTYGGPTTTAKGSLVVNPDGSFVYTPTDTARHDAATTGAGTNLTTDTFTVTATNSGGTVGVPVTVNIVPRNATAAVGTATAIPGDDGRVSGAVSVTDPDHDTVTYSGPTTSAKGGTVHVNADGTYSYSPTDAARHDAATTGAGSDLTTDTFTVTADDGHGGTTPVAVTVTIKPSNTAAPTGTVTPNAGIGSDGTVTGIVKVVDPQGDTVIYSGPTTSAKGGTVVVNPDGSYSYTPTPTARHDAAADGASTRTKTDTFTVTAADGHGGTTPVQVTVNIDSANAAPAMTVGQGSAANALGGVTYGTTVTDADQDSTHLTISTPAHGKVVDNHDGTFTYTPNADALLNKIGTLTDSFTVTASDGHGGTTQPVTITYSYTSPIVAQYPVGNGYPMVDPIASTNGAHVVTLHNEYGYTSDNKYYANAVVTRIDTATNTATTTRYSGQGATYTDPTGNKTYVLVRGSDSDSTTVVVVDRATDTVTALPTVSGYAAGLTFNANGTKAYLPLSHKDTGATDYATTVTVIDTSTNATTTTQPVAGSSNGSVVFGPDPTHAYLVTTTQVNPGSSGGPYLSRLSIIDTTTNGVQTLGAVPGRQITNIVFSPDGRTILLTPYDYGSQYSNGESATYTPILIDTQTNTQTVLPTRSGIPQRDAIFSSDDRYAYQPITLYTYDSTLNRYVAKGSMTIIDTQNRTATTLPTLPTNTLVLDKGKYLVEVAYGNGASPTTTLRFIDKATGTVTTMPPQSGGLGYYDMQFDPSGNRAYLSLVQRVAATDTKPESYLTTLTVYDTSTNTPTVIGTTSQPGSYSGPVQFAPDGAHAYRVSYTDRSGSQQYATSVTIIDAVTGAAETTTFDGYSPGPVQFSPDGKRAYLVVNDYDNANPHYTVRVIDTATSTMTSLPLSNGTAPNRQVTFTPDGRYAYFVATTLDEGGAPSSKIVFVNTATNAVTESESVPGYQYSDLRLSPDGRYVYVVGATTSYDNAIQASTTHRVVRVVDLSTAATVKTFTVDTRGASPSPASSSPDGRYLYLSSTDYRSATSDWTTSVTIVDTVTGASVSSPPITGQTYTGNPVFYEDATHVYVRTYDYDPFTYGGTPFIVTTINKPVVSSSV